MRSKLPKALSDERKRKEVEEKQRQVQQLEQELGKGIARSEDKRNKRDKSRTYNLLDIKEAVEIKPQDYSKAINTKEFQFVQKPRDGTQNYEGQRSCPGGGFASPHYTSEVTKPSKKGKGLRSKYDLT